MNKTKYKQKDKLKYLSSKIENEFRYIMRRHDFEDKIIRFNISEEDMTKYMQEHNKGDYFDYLHMKFKKTHPRNTKDRGLKYKESYDD